MLDSTTTTFDEFPDFADLNEEEQIALLMNATDIDIETSADVNEHLDVVVSEESIRGMEIEHMDVTVPAQVIQ